MIPDWDARGLLPTEFYPNSSFRSPYLVSLKDVVRKYSSISKERITILRGFLQYREALHAAGAKSGFQWLDGSFFEDIEGLENRHPRDIDVVTFLADPDKVDKSKKGFLLNPFTKTNYMVDAYFMELNMRLDLLIEMTTYWYGMWSHRRDHTWKGFLQVDLDPAEDDEAREFLRKLN